MRRLIDAIELEKKIMNDWELANIEEGYWINYLMATINNTPTIKLKHGKWIVDRYCSECEWDKKEAALVTGIPTNFCPNCRAKMQEKK